MIANSHSCQLGHLHTCITTKIDARNHQQKLQSKLSDIVSYLSHYGMNFMANSNKICFVDDDEHAKRIFAAWLFRFLLFIIFLSLVLLFIICFDSCSILVQLIINFCEMLLYLHWSFCIVKIFTDFFFPSVWRHVRRKHICKNHENRWRNMNSSGKVLLMCLYFTYKPLESL